MKNIRLEKKDNIALLTINRPDLNNALDKETYDEFETAINDIKNDTYVRVLVIAGAGKSFSSGIDLNFAASLNNFSSAEFRILVQKIQNIFLFEKIDKPVISAVRGFALGNGCDIALASDMIFASDNAQFGMAYTNIGLIPDLGGTFRLPRLVGTAMAKEIILTGERINAKKALEIGMVNRVVSDEKLMDETMTFAAKLAKRAPVALALAKKAINNSLGTDLYCALEFETYLQSVCIQSKDVTEAVTAFMEKREPEFTGK